MSHFDQNSQYRILAQILYYRKFAPRLDGDYAAYLLFDEARIGYGEQPVDPRGFSVRLARVIGQATG